MELVVEISNQGWPASSMAIGAGVWVMLGWAYLGARRWPSTKRLEFVAVLGLVCAAAFLGGMLLAQLLGTPGMSSLGALGGGAAALFFLPLPQQWSRWRLVDRVIPAGLAGLAVARLGCLFEGCDVGRITAGNWGVVYERGSRVWDAHLVFYDLSLLSETSFAVQPFALYLAGWGVLAAGFGQWSIRRDRSAGEAGLFSAALFLAGGAVIEWSREPQLVVQLVEGVSAYPPLYLGGAAVAFMLGIKRKAQSRTL